MQRPTTASTHHSRHGPQAVKHLFPLTAGQKAFIGLEYERYFAEEQPAPERDEKGQFTGRPESGTPSVPNAAEVVGVGKNAISQAKAIQRDAPDLAAKVQADELSLEAADRHRVSGRRTATTSARSTGCTCRWPASACGT